MRGVIVDRKRHYFPSSAHHVRMMGIIFPVAYHGRMTGIIFPVLPLPTWDDHFFLRLSLSWSQDSFADISGGVSYTQKEAASS